MINLIDVSDVAGTFNLQPIKAYRIGPAIEDRGEFTPGPRTLLPIKSADVQFGTSRDVSFLPEGQRKLSMITVFTVKRLKAADEKTGATGDEVEWGGSIWWVAKVFNWTTNGYNEAIAIEVDEP